MAEKVSGSVYSSEHQPEPDSGERTSALVEEIQYAFRTGGGKKLRKELASSPDLQWLHQQCSGGLYPLYPGDRSKLSFFDKQTCKRWKSMVELERVKHPLRQRRRLLLIQPITYLHGNSNTRLHGNSPLREGVAEEEVRYGHTNISETILELLREFCAAYFSEMQVKLAPSLDLSQIPRLTSRIHKATNRRQFLVDDIINFLSAKKLRKAYCVLGVTIVDLYPGPEWNFVLGQACMDKGSGVFSFGRYFNSAVSSGGGGRGRMGEGQCGDELGSAEQVGNLWVLMRVSPCSQRNTV